MLPARHRFPLRRYPDFFTQARRVASPHLLIYVQPAEVFAAAVIVPQKALTQTTAPAVVRHKLKRMATEILANHGLKKPVSLVVVFKPRSENLDFTQLETELLKVLNPL
jgi:ribonuclease P protein component